MENLLNTPIQCLIQALKDKRNKLQASIHKRFSSIKENFTAQAKEEKLFYKASYFNQDSLLGDLHAPTKHEKDFLRSLNNQHNDAR